MASRLRGWKALIHDAVSATTKLVGEGHDSTGRVTVRFVSLVPGLVGPVRVVNQSRKLATDGILATVRGVNRAVEVVTDMGLDFAGADAEGPPEVTMRSDAMGTAAWVEDALLGAVNGVIGDHLHRRSSALALGMSLRGAPGGPTRTQVGRRVAIWIHGLATTEWSWCLDAERLLGDPAANFGTLLERDLGFTPLYVRYNTGRHVSENGQALAAMLTELVSQAPEIEEIVLIGHSMGGLVARSATHVSDVSAGGDVSHVGDVSAGAGHSGEAKGSTTISVSLSADVSGDADVSGVGDVSGNGSSWRSRLTWVICLGTPHQGAPLERFGHGLTRALQAIDLPATRIPAAILRARSEGIKDLGHGDVHASAWQGRDIDAAREAPDGTGEAALLDGVSYAFIAGAVTADPSHPVGAAMGDLLVQVHSAEGPRVLGVSPVTQRIGGVMHQAIQVDPRVYQVVKGVLGG